MRQAEPTVASFVYRPGARCPGCGGAAWNVGRTVVECANPRCGVVVAVSGQR